MSVTGRRYQVAIVGGGPVGMALAVDLGQRGVSCVVVERHREVGRIPKGQNLSPRSLEHFYFWNCVRELRAARLLPPDSPLGGIRVYGDLTSDYWHATKYFEEVLGLFFQRNERLPQYLTEEVLRARAADLASVTVLFENTVTSVAQDDAGVEVTVSQQVWPYEDELLRADYVVGCDGARSLVRSQLGIERSGTDLGEKMVLAVFESPELYERLQRFEERSTYQVISPELRGVWQFFGRVEQGISWFYHGPVPPDTTRDDRERVHRAMEVAAGFSFPAVFQHIGFWDLRVDVADVYRRDRAFIAGDAAHSHPPYGAYGLNSGLEDAVNLGWKLAAALEGWGGDVLLDSYSRERQPVFAQTAEDMIIGGVLRDRDWLARHSPELDGAGFAEAWRQRSALRYARYDPHYAGSPVVLGPPDGATGIHGQLTPAACAGHHLSSQQLTSGRNVFEELGPGFTLLDFGHAEEAANAFASAAQTLGVPLKVVRDPGAKAGENYECDLVLVRPDQHVAWAGDTAPPDVRRALAHVTGR